MAQKFVAGSMGLGSIALKSNDSPAAFTRATLCSSCRVPHQLMAAKATA